MAKDREDYLDIIRRCRNDNVMRWHELMSCIDKVVIIRSALEAKPDTARKILKEIADNDQQVVEATRKLIA